MPKPRVTTFKEKIKLAGELASSAGALIGLVETIVQLRQFLPFGQGIEMPSDYDYLVEKAGSVYPELPSSLIAFTKGSGDVDWALARHIYDNAYQMLQSDVSHQIAAEQLLRLESSMIRLIDSMRPEFRAMVLAELGD